MSGQRLTAESLKQLQQQQQLQQQMNRMATVQQVPPNAIGPQLMTMQNRNNQLLNNTSYSPESMLNGGSGNPHSLINNIPRMTQNNPTNANQLQQAIFQLQQQQMGQQYTQPNIYKPNSPPPNNPIMQPTNNPMVNPLNVNLYQQQRIGQPMKQDPYNQNTFIRQDENSRIQREKQQACNPDYRSAFISKQDVYNRLHVYRSLDYEIKMDDKCKSRF